MLTFYNVTCFINIKYINIIFQLYACHKTLQAYPGICYSTHILGFSASGIDLGGRGSCYLLYPESLRHICLLILPPSEAFYSQPFLIELFLLLI